MDRMKSDYRSLIRRSTNIAWSLPASGMSALVNSCRKVGCQKILADDELRCLATLTVRRTRVRDHADNQHTVIAVLLNRKVGVGYFRNTSALYPVYTRPKTGFTQALVRRMITLSSLKIAICLVLK